MGNKKRILAWILSLAMVFGLFAGQVSVAKAASLGIYKFELESDKLPSEGGELVVNIQFDDFATTDIPIYYQLKKAVGEYEYEVVEGYDNVEGQVVGNKLKINIPANKETKDVKYKLIVNLTSGKFETLWGTAETGAKRATFTVAAATGTEPGTPDTQKVLPDESHFRARAVDQNGNPVAGVKFDVKNSYNNLASKSVTSDANGVVEIAIDQYDIDAAKTISLAENDKWECETTHSYTTYYYEGKIEKIDGQNLRDISEELVYVLKEKGAAEKADKVALKAAIDEATAIDTNKFSAGVEELKNALAEANTVYANEKATQTEVDAQVANLKAAIEALVEKEPQPEPKPEPEPQPEVKKVGAVALKTTVYTYNGKVKKPAVVAKNDKKKDIGTILIGFAVLMFGMETMSEAVKPLADVPEFTNILTMFHNPFLGVLAGAVLTAIIQSSSASVGILQALSVTGAFTYGSVIPIIMGQNIGTCVTAMISAIGANRGAKRTAFVHLYFNVIGTVLFLVLFYTGNALIGFEFTNEVVGAAGIAMIHTIFNVFATLVLLPFTKGLEKLAYLTIPKTAEEQNQKEDVFVILDDRFLNSPAFAIEQCHSLANQMAKITHEGFLEAMTVLDEYSEEKIEDVIAKENIVDTYDDKLSAYLTKLSSQNLSYKDSLKVTSLLHCLTDFERISDHSINVVENAQQMYKEGAVFSKKAKEEMKVYSTALRDILERTTNAFVDGDEALARTVEPLEEVIDELNKTVKKNHMKRLRKGKCTIELGLVLSDLAMNYERVADHCSNIAVYMMQLEDTQLEEHSFTEQLDAEESAEFTKQLNEFEKIYQI